MGNIEWRLTVELIYFYQQWISITNGPGAVALTLIEQKFTRTRFIKYDPERKTEVDDCLADNASPTKLTKLIIIIS
jgi:hypothetical protein